MSLSGADTYSGATTVSAGVLNIQNATALGTTGSGTTVATRGVTGALVMSGTNNYGGFTNAGTITGSGTWSYTYRFR